MVAGLIALRILTDHAGDVRLGPGRSGHIGWRSEQAIELGDECRVAAVQVDEPRTACGTLKLACQASVST